MLSLALVGQSTGQGDEKPDVVGKIKEIKKAEEGDKNLGSITVTVIKKGQESKDVKILIGKKTEITKAAGKEIGQKASLDEMQEGGFAAIWLEARKESSEVDMAQKIVIVHPLFTNLGAVSPFR